MLRRRTNREVMNVYNCPEEDEHKEQVGWGILIGCRHRHTRKVLMGGEGAKHRKGRPKKKWLENVKEDIRLLKVQDWEERIKDRSKWGKIVKNVEAMNLQA